jgi:hypothetical protein
LVNARLKYGSTIPVHSRGALDDRSFEGLTQCKPVEVRSSGHGNRGILEAQKLTPQDIPALLVKMN